MKYSLQLELLLFDGAFNHFGISCARWVAFGEGKKVFCIDFENFLFSELGEI
jgi:hypothetical protein